VSTIIPFEFPETSQQVRAVTIDGEPWFVVADVCRVLGIGNPSDAARRLNAGDLDTVEVTDSLGRRQQAHAANESGLYDLILDSRKPEARAFRRWITAEVIPSIRRTGSYSVARPAELSRGEILRLALAAEEEAERLRAERAELTGRVAELEPAAAAWDALASAAGDYSLRDAAAILSRDPAISTGQNRLMRSLRELRMVDAKGVPYARHVDAGRVVERASAYTHPHSGEAVLGRPQVRITVAGLRYLHPRLGGLAPLRFDGQLPLDPAA
jgi:prophage antirepressor-like protein